MKIISECHDKDNGLNYHDDSKMSGYCCMLHKTHRSLNSFTVE